LPWTPLALSRDVPPLVTRAVILDGKELVIWRGESRTVQIWQDRCPHRGMRLSFGFVRGDRLACLYHGWEYGAGSNCVRIPAHPDLEVPPTIRAKTYPSAETGGMIWLGDEAAASEPPLVLAGKPIASMTVEAEAADVLSLTGASPIEGAQLVEAELDGVHLNIGWHVPRRGCIMLHAVALDPGDVESKAVRALHHLRAEAERSKAA
jgi:phenylpropionate dioxygenase-like ring-hydroxylating dioxygenase large terminal subunit